MAIKEIIAGILLLVTLCNCGPLEEKRLIKTSHEKPAEWMTETQIWQELVGKHINFMDVTGYSNPDVVKPVVETQAIPTAPRYQAQVRPLFSSINTSRMEDFIRHFSSYHTRYYTSTTGTQSQQWLLGQVRESLAGYAGSASVREFAHSWAQSSIIARIEGSDPTLREEVVIFGAHQDSVNRNGPTLNAPGADDNGSGSVAILEVLRILVANRFIPKRTIEFHWYAAEEVGLRGSAEIARSYASGVRVNVVAMMNLDVPGYNAGSTNIGVYTDNVSAAVTQFVRLLIEEYCEFGWQNRTCGYACSDHASWTQNGFPSCFPAEVTFHPQMHTVNDNFAGVNFIQVGEFVKMAIGFAIEIAEPQ